MPDTATDAITLRIDALDVHVRGHGPRTVVMLHGWPDTEQLWEPQVQALQAHARCVTFTLPGFDRAHPRRIRNQQELVDQIQRIVQAVSPDAPVTLLLHDWGCIFGFAYAQAHPSHVEAIAAVDVADAGSPAHLAELSGTAKLGMAAYQLLLALAWHLPARWGDALTRRVARWARAPSASASVGAHMNSPYVLQWTGRLRRSTALPEVPMLFAWGQRKPFMFHSRAWVEQLRARPRSQAAGLPCGHWVTHDQAPAFNRLLLDWLAGLPPVTRLPR